MTGKKVMTEVFSLNDIPGEIRAGIENSPERIYRSDGWIYLLLEMTIIRCEDTAAGNEMIHGIISRKEANEQPGSKSAVLRKIMCDPDYKPDRKLLKKYGIDQGTGGTVAVFRSYMPQENDLNELICDMVPLEAGDLPVPIDRATVALVRKNGHMGTDELKEYAEAVICTMESEGIVGIRTGIGRDYNGLAELRNSYLEAREALSIGMKFQGKDNVFCYDSQTLERILDCIPAERTEQFRKEFPGIYSPDIMTDEMKETVRVFFRNDLNLTAAARQLFVHRNTLNYRLDKIRRETGLDLRSFRDAVIFSILSGLTEKI